MRTRHLGQRIVLIASLIATATVVSSEILIGNDRAEAASSQEKGGGRDRGTPTRSKPGAGKPIRVTTTTTAPATTTTTPATATAPVTTTSAPATTTTAPVVTTTAPATTTTAPATTTTTPVVTTTTAPVVTTTTAAPVVAALSLTFLPSGGTSGWSMEVSDARHSITNDGTRLTSEVGGFDASTHYARLRRKLPETDNIAPRGPFTIGAGIELPSDFYSKAESYVRFITTDNYPGTMRVSGARVGAASGDEWRVGFLIYGSDQLPRLVSEHENRETIVLWKGTSRLPTGQNDIEIDFTPSQGTDGAFEISINGVVVSTANGVRTVPSTLTPAEVVVTRVGTGLDGAANQDTQRLTTHVSSFSFVAQW